MLVLNTLPLAVALGIDGVAENYSAGYFDVLAGRLAGNWLESFFQLGANVCLVGLYNAAVLTAERSLAFLVQCHYADEMGWLAGGGSEGAPAVRCLFRPTDLLFYLRGRAHV